MDNYEDINDRRFENPYSAQLIHMGAMTAIEKAFFNFLIKEKKWVNISLSSGQEISGVIVNIIIPVAILVEPKTSLLEESNGNIEWIYTHQITFISYVDLNKEFRPSSLT